MYLYVFRQCTRRHKVLDWMLAHIAEVQLSVRCDICSVFSSETIVPARNWCQDHWGGVQSPKKTKFRSWLLLLFSRRCATSVNVLFILSSEISSSDSLGQLPTAMQVPSLSKSRLIQCKAVTAFTCPKCTYSFRWEILCLVRFESSVLSRLFWNIKHFFCNVPTSHMTLDSKSKCAYHTNISFILTRGDDYETMHCSAALSCLWTVWRHSAEDHTFQEISSINGSRELFVVFMRAHTIWSHAELTQITTL
jgi:hypothetical protein